MPAHLRHDFGPLDLVLPSGDVSEYGLLALPTGGGWQDDLHDWTTLSQTHAAPVARGPGLAGWVVEEVIGLGAFNLKGLSSMFVNSGTQAAPRSREVLRRGLPGCSAAVLSVSLLEGSAVVKVSAGGYHWSLGSLHFRDDRASLTDAGGSEVGPVWLAESCVQHAKESLGWDAVPSISEVRHDKFWTIFIDEAARLAQAAGVMTE